MGTQFGLWPPTGKTPLKQMGVRSLVAAGIAQDGTIGTDPLGAVESVDHSGTGVYLVHLKFTPDANTTVAATLVGAAGEVDAAASGSGVLVHTRDSAGAAADKAFYLHVFG